MSIIFGILWGVSFFKHGRFDLLVQICWHFLSFVCRCMSFLKPTFFAQYSQFCTLTRHQLCHVLFVFFEPEPICFVINLLRCELKFFCNYFCVGVWECVNKVLPLLWCHSCSISFFTSSQYLLLFISLNDLLSA